MEIWKKIEGLENYEISNFGRIKSLERFKNNNGGLVYKPEKILKLNFTTNRYLTAFVTENKIRYTLNTHRLVAIAFIPNPKNKPQVNHINGIKHDNRVENLEWVTSRENVKHFSEKLNKNKTSKYIGVHKNNSKYISQIRILNKTYTLGTFKTEEEAKKEYEKALDDYNQKNILPIKKTSTNEKYISFNKTKNKFHVYYILNRKYKTIGFYKDINEAIIKRNEYHDKK